MNMKSWKQNTHGQVRVPTLCTATDIIDSDMKVDFKKILQSDFSQIPF